MVMPANNGKLVRLGKLRELTGWSEKYIYKLVANGLLTIYRPFPGAKAWYRLDEALDLQQKKGTQNHE